MTVVGVVGEEPRFRVVEAEIIVLPLPVLFITAIPAKAPGVVIVPPPPLNVVVALVLL